MLLFSYSSDGFSGLLLWVRTCKDLGVESSYQDADFPHLVLFKSKYWGSVPIVGPEVHYPLGNVVLFCCEWWLDGYEIIGYEIGMCNIKICPYSLWIGFKMFYSRNIIFLKRRYRFCQKGWKTEGPDVLTLSESNDIFGYYSLLPSPTPTHTATWPECSASAW